MRILSIKTIESKELVYNFSVEDDESYVLNGIVSHNCRCDVSPTFKDAPDVPESNQGDFEDWLAS